MSISRKLLIVEDDLNLGFLLTDLLEIRGYDVKLCKDGQMGLQAIRRCRYDLGILDVMMPGIDGFDLSRKIRKIQPDLPFIFLTAKSRKQDKMNGYALGAEDFVTKPFDEDELICKLEVIMRRNILESAKEILPSSFQIGKFTYAYELQELRFHDRIYRLTEKENEILRLLCLNKNKILRRDEAVEKVYGRKDYFLGRSFDVFISKIRKRFREDPAIVIENVFKVGFILKIREQAIN